MEPNTITTGDCLLDSWAGSYNDSWKGLITPESFAHPAKMSRGLLDRILRHAKEEGWLKPGDVVLDCFSGVATTAILGAYEGYRCIGIELEEKFHLLGLANIALHAKKLAALNCPQPIILQGDSRELCKLLANCDCVISSPPFQESLQSKDAEFHAKWCQEHGRDVTKPNYVGKIAGYGHSPGQLGAMRAGSIDCVPASPPYSEGLGHGGKPTRGGGRTDDRNLDGMQQGYGSKGNLKPSDVDLICASPPYEGNPQAGESKNGFVYTGKHNYTGKRCSINRYDTVKSSHNLGNTQGDTFWGAAKIIVEQCHQILKEGGVAMPDGENIEFCECGK